MASFVSSREIEAAKELKKQEKREAREVLLKHAKEDHEKRKRRKEQREERGEDKWLAPGVMDRFDSEDTSSRKHKRHKNKKKHSKHSKHSKSSSESSDESEGDMWVEKGGHPADNSEQPVEKEQDSTVNMLERDSWMTAPMAPSQQSLFAIEDKRRSQQQAKAKAEMKVSPLDNPGQHPRELNPYWKDGGSGMPQESDKQSSKRCTGDGGRSWMLRAYKRALEQAEREGKDLREIATERWGSLEKLHSLLRAAGIDPSNPDKAPRSGRREYLYADPPRSTKPLSLKRRPADVKRSTPHGSNDESTSKPQGFLIPGQTPVSESQAALERSQSRDSYRSANWHKQRPARKEEYTQSQVSSQPQPSTQEPIQAPEQTNLIEPEVTDAQLNALSAKVIKAEMLGDSKKVETLKTKLERLRELKSQQEKQKSVAKRQQDSSDATEEKAIPLMSTDRFGRMRPLDMSSSGESQRDRAPPSKKSKRKKYTEDGEGYNIQDLIQQERKMTAMDTQLALAGMASKFVSSSNTDDTIDEKHASKVAVSYDPRQNEGKDMVRAMVESRKLAETMETCKFCFGNEHFRKNLLVAVGINVYLSVPATQSLTDGHCLLVPMEHHTSMIQLDENVWDELRVFQKGLTRMFSDRDCDIVFTESYMSSSKRSHAYLECIPIPREQGELAPMYFKKAIMESDEEWSINRKLIDTKKKGVRNSLPIGLPYFFVDFGLDGGYAHVIEDQGKFPSHFAKEVVGGMLDLQPRLWLKPPLDSFETQKSKALKVSEWWKDYDWTQKLKN